MHDVWARKLFMAMLRKAGLEPFRMRGSAASREQSMHWVFLALAIVVAAYGTAFFFLSQALKAIPVGVAYAIWSGVGTALIAIIAWVLYGQALNLPAFIGIGLIIAGVVVLNLFSGSAAHG